MSKKILNLSSAKLTAISVGLLLAVFCTIGMSFRPVYDENEAEEIVMSGPRRSHWKKDDGCGGYDYYNKTDYARTVAQSMNVAYGTVEITAKAKGSDPVTAADGSQSYVDWDTGLGTSETTGQRNDLEVIHTNTFTFTAAPTDPEEYRFVGWYSDAGGNTQVSKDNPWEDVEVKFPDQAGFTSYKSNSGVTTYEGSTRYTVTYYAKFAQIPAINVTFLAASTPAKDKGSYTVVGKGVNSTITTSNQVIPVKSITLTATPSEATEFLNWYKLGAGDEKIILSTENPFTTSFTEKTTVGVEWRELEKNLTIVFKAVEKDESGVRKGSYTVDGVTVSATDYEHFTGDTYRYSPTLVATPATGYSFKGWYVKEAGVKRYLSTDATWTPTITEELTIYADFVFTAYPAESLAQFKVGSTYYDDLNAANTAAKSASKKVIICTRDGYLLPGNYTISSGVSLLIPYSTAETVQTEPAVVDKPSPAPLPNAYRTLTMLDGADITCEGTICVGGQIISHQGGNATAYPAGDLGVINMANGGHIELKSGATLYAWGFIKGQDKDQGNNTTGVGTITANNGSTVWEDIPFGDFRGGSQLAAGNECADDYRWFPFQSYTIQNIEVPLTIKYGASEKVFAVLYIPTMDLGTQKTKPTLIANSDALFLLKDSKSGVRKWYDPTTDLVCYELSGTAQLDQLIVSVNVGITVTVKSSDFDLPICGNMHIILTNCNMTLSKPMTMHAGSVIEIKPDATVTIASNLHVFDLDQFDMFANSKYYLPFNNFTSHKYRGTGTTKEYINDARLIVDGTLKVTGGIYTTANGANIMGNGGGKVIFQSALPGEKNIWFLKGGSNGTQAGGTHYHYDGIFGKGAADIYFTPYAVNAANLCNEDGSYTKSLANKTFHNVHGRWFVDGKQNEQSDHTHAFTYMASGNSGTDVNTPAVYSHDRTGLEPRMKWFNVSEDGCADWWVDGNSRLYNWSKFSDWHQFIPTEVTDMYGCSNGSLYNKISCTVWEELGGTDENCLYTIGGVKKALVGTSFIEMEPNADDAAYHRTGAATEYYISFDGCIWHSATRIEGERKAYTVEEQQFIWFENNWLNVTREAPFFYSTDELNVKTYYEYIGSEWVIAEPYVRVTTSDPTQTRSLLTFYEAVAVANQYKNPTITILRDIPTGSESAVYTAANTTCTLDLNGHKVTSVCQYMLNINAAGSTFIIKDKTSDKKGELRACPEGGNARTIGYQVTKGTLKLESGKMYSTNTTTRTGSTAETFTSATNTGVVVKANAVFTVTGGTVESEDEHQPYAVKVETNGTMNLSGTGEIKAHATTWYSTRGVSLEYGNLNMSGGSILSSAIGASTVYGVFVGASASWNAAKSTSSSSYGTLTLTGGTITARTPKDARGVQVSGAADVTGDYNESPINQTVKLREYGRCNISGGSINAEATTSTTAFGILSYGTTSITGGNITANVLTSSQSTAYGVRVDGGVTTINGSANIVANAPTVAYGVLVQGVVDGNRGWCHYGELNIKGGTITANTTNKTKAYGLYVTATTKNLANTNSYSVFNGNYAAHGTAIITGGHFYANARTTTAIGIDVEGTKTLNEASATPVCTINGGYYKMTGTGDLLGCNTAALPANFQINGGYYSHEGNLEGYAVSPKHVVTLPSSDPNRPDYEYKVAEAYTITFKSENGETTLQSSYQEKGTTPEYNGEPQTKPSSTTTSYVFDGWSSSIGGSLVSPLTSVTSSGGTYYAHFNETTLKYMVTLDAKTNGGNEEAQVIYVEPSAAVGTLPTATKTGYTQTGWYTAASGGTKLETTTSITADGTYYAQFGINSHTLTWNLAGGTVKTAGTGAAASATGSPSSSVNYNATITAPVVTKTGYTFANWGVPYPASKMPDNDLSYTAHWNPATNTKYYVKHYQQNINDDGYTLADTETKTGTTDATVTPDRKSYDGFLTPDPQSLTIGAAGTSSLTYNYDRVVYTIKWNAYANGGTCSAPNTNIRHGKTLGTMPEATPNSAGLVFGGWYTAADGGTRITESTPILQNYGTLYAHFVPTYTVTWKNYDESVLATIELPYDAIPSYGSNPTPTRATDEDYGYTFDGWSATNGGTIVEEPLPAIFGNKTYYAHYSTTPTVASVKVGSTTTYYTTIDAAFAFANEQTANMTIKLLKNTTAAASLVYSAVYNCTLDLNNRTLSGAINKLIEINATGKTFTIDDSSVAKGGKISTTLSTNARLNCVYLTAGTLILEKGYIYSSNPHTYSTASGNKNSAATGVYVVNGNTFTMDGGKVESESQYASYAIVGKNGTSTITINGGEIYGHTTKSTTSAGIYTEAKGLTVNGGNIKAQSFTTTARGIYIYGGTGTINGGTVEAVIDTVGGSGTTTAYGIAVGYKNTSYKGTLTIPSTSTVVVKVVANTNTAGGVVAGGGTVSNKIQGGTYYVRTKTGKSAYGVSLQGTTTLSGGTFRVNAATTDAYGILCQRATTPVSGNPNFIVHANTTTAIGIVANGYIPAKGGTTYGGTVNVGGGTFTVSTGSGNTAYGALAQRTGKSIYSTTNDSVPKNYANAGTITITGGEFDVTTYASNSYAVFCNSATTQKANTSYDAVTATPKLTVSGGRFVMYSDNGANTTCYAANTAAKATNFLIQGGWYSTKRTDASSTSNLEDKYTAPGKASCTYYTMETTSVDKASVGTAYNYKVAEGYQITFNNYDGTQLQQSYQQKNTTAVYDGATPERPEDASYTYAFAGWSPALASVTAAATYTATYASTPRTYDITLNTNGGTINAGNVEHYTVGTGATLPTNVTKSGFTFGGWFDNDGLTGDAVTTISTTATGNKEYWAKWTASIADRELDIVDWTSNSITINVTNLKAVGGTNKNNWKIRVNGTDYTRTSPECSTQSRTLTISGLSLTPNDNLLIQLKNDADVIESQHYYKIPQIYTANATLDDTDAESVVYVYGGKLTISGDATLAALYVCPGAEVEVTDGTLTVGKLVLRTKPWATVAISGNVSAANVYYTRIAPDGSSEYPTGQYYQFGLPYECDIDDVLLSDGTTPAYNTTWILKSYNEERRAESGTSTNNWDALAADATIEAGRGYEMFSSYKYYREYYFPVIPTDNTSVAVTRHGKDKNNSGWNIVCSPLMSIYQNESDPVTGLKVSWLLADGSYDQEWPETIWPALPFSYQASATGYLDFSTNDLNQAVSAPRRAAYKENIQTEWLHLDVKDGNGVGDHTSVFVHPDRFEATYQTGIDVAKQSFTASRALIYSSHAYGEMAFAGVADVLLENGVALTVYSPKEQELTISMRDNEWLDRMAYVWLIDNETGAQIDLLDSDYTFEAAAGTTTGRFILMGRFFAPQIATDIDQAEGEQAKPKKLIIRDKLYILINDQLYDGTGKMVK